MVIQTNFTITGYDIEILIDLFGRMILSGKRYCRTSDSDKDTLPKIKFIEFSAT